MRLPDHGAEAASRRAGAGIAIFKTGCDVAHAGAFVERDNFDSLAFVVVIGADQDFAARTVLDEVCRKFGRDQRQFAGLDVGKSCASGQVGCRAPCFRDAALVVDINGFHLISNVRC